MFSIIVGIIVLIITTVCNVVMFRKAGYKGWEAVVPYYNTWCMMKLIGLPAWHAVIIFCGQVLSVIPFIGALFSIAYVLYMLCFTWMFYKTYGVPISKFILSCFFAPIVMPMIAFSDKYNYQGPLYELKETKFDIVIFIASIVGGIVSTILVVVPLVVGLLTSMYYSMYMNSMF